MVAEPASSQYTRMDGNLRWLYWAAQNLSTPNEIICLKVSTCILSDPLMNCLLLSDACLADFTLR